MIPVFYEIKRALTSKSVLIITIVIVLFSLLGTLTLGLNESVSSSQIVESNAYGYGSNGNYTAVIYLFNGYGQPVQGQAVHVEMNSGTVVKHYNATSGSDGFANVSMNNINTSAYYNPKLLYFSYNYSSAYTGFFQSGEIFTNTTNPYFFYTEEPAYNATKGATYNTSIPSPRYVIDSINVQNNQRLNGLKLFYESNGSASQKVDLYYEGIYAGSGGPVTRSPVNNYTESNMNLYGSFSGFSSVNIIPSNLSKQNYTFYEFALFAPNGTMITQTTVVVNVQAASSQSVTQIFYSSIMGIMGFFVPLMASLAGYFTYGKDKTGGVLESVLVRPVSRIGLVFSRYLANTTSVFLATAASLGISSLAFYYTVGTFVPAYPLEVALLALLIEICAFTGIIYLASSFLKSQGALLGLTIILFFVFVLFWSGSLLGIPIIPFIVTSVALKFVPGTVAFSKTIVEMLYISPAGYTSIAEILAGSGTTLLLLNSPNVSLASLGVSNTYLVITGLIWIVVPAVLAMYVFSRKD